MTTTMSASYLKPFFSATNDVFKMMLDVEAVPQDPAKTGHLGAEANEVNIVIGMTGDLNGDVLYRFPQNTTLEIARIMTGGMDFDEVDDFVTSAIGEIANIISGNALTNLSEQQLTCDILPPRVIVGDDNTLAAAQGSALKAQMHTAIGDLEIDMAVSDAKNS